MQLLLQANVAGPGCVEVANQLATWGLIGQMNRFGEQCQAAQHAGRRNVLLDGCLSGWPSSSTSPQRASCAPWAAWHCSPNMFIWLLDGHLHATWHHHVRLQQSYFMLRGHTGDETAVKAVKAMLLSACRCYASKGPILQSLTVVGTRERGSANMRCV